MKRLLHGSVLLFLTTMTLVGCSFSSSVDNETNESNEEGIKERNFVTAHIVPEGHVWHQSLLVLEEEVAEATDGKWTFDYYPQGTLGNQNDMYQQLQVGSIDLSVLVGAELNSHSEAFASWTMPFIMRNHEDAFEMAQTEEAHALFETLDQVEGKGYFFAGMRHVLAKNGPIESIEDLQGVPLRISPSPAITDFWQEAGAGPTPVPAADLYTSFQTGVVDAIDIDLDLMMNNAYNDIGSYFTPLNHMTWPGTVLLNEQLWNDFSEEEKEIFNNALEKAIAANKEMVIQMEQDYMQDFEEQGGTISNIENLDPFYEVAEKVHKDYGERNDYIQDFIDKAKEISEYDR
ncbi:TRAP-type C4-dicarboxylate transport system, substrate-binding protein [Alteribacillus persepolensis]|uniref:TRAP-type C4-dicarboxylate transport system, substrate-binding protein n=1 Tax=Alteribacillus persepolensis TaxID=568899 RepID=A0A1G8A7Z4_9BACI|nr:TRAP transporter substrate-binding protein [Alteribacillus persepolensis]SDH16510.1 TRAP-type C4-dicarboxylate transport system, substrate-binding protein [Alteribacillus persepolensis]